MSHAIRERFAVLLDGSKAHTPFQKAVADMPAALRGVVPRGLPYSAWQIVEHIRIAQRDMLDFSRNNDGGYQPKNWPEDYWPKDPMPSTEAAWSASVSAVARDHAEFVAMIESADDAGLIEPFAWEPAQSLLGETMQIVQHMSYHTGELIVVRRLLGTW